MSQIGIKEIIGGLHMRLYLLIALTLIMIPLSAQTISEITSITYDRIVTDFDWYEGSISRYENRLFVNAYGKIEEHLIAEDGSLTRISFFETGYHNENHAIVSDDRLYRFYMLNNHLYMMIFDLQSIPMELVTTLQVPFTATITQYSDPFIPQEMGDYLILSSTSNPRTAWFHKPTMTFAPTTSGNFNLFTTYNSFIIAPTIDQTTQQRKLVFYDYETANTAEPYGRVVSDLYFEVDASADINNMKMVGDHLYLMGEGFLLVYDISDIDNMELVFSLPNAGNFTDAIFCGDKLITYSDYYAPTHRYGLIAYNLTDPANPVEIYFDDLDTNLYVLFGIHVFNDKLYLNSFTWLRVYDINQNGLQLLHRYGNHQMHSQISGEYLLENLLYEKQFRLSNMLQEDAEPITIDTEVPIDFSIMGSFIVKGNFLFGIIYLGGYSYGLDMYNLDTLERVDRVYLVEVGQIYAFGDYIFVETERFYGGQPYNNQVFSYSGGRLSLQGSVYGWLAREDPQNRDCPYFAINTGSNIEFREKANPLNLLHAQPFSVDGVYRLTYQVGNQLGFRVNNTTSFRIYTWDDDFTNYRQTATMSVPTTHDIEYYNGVLQLGGGYFSNKKFYSVIGGQPTLIGEMDFPQCGGTAFFYPEDNKMILWAVSGAHLYDIEYALSETDTVAEPFASLMLHNYPNPFNPSTTISFTLSRNTTVCLDIYNLKGQKIIGLVDGVFGAGVHKVVWNGIDENGRSVSSGVYLYQMRAERCVETKKMVMVK